MNVPRLGLSMRVFLISESKPGFGAGLALENALGIPSDVEPSTAGQSGNTLAVLCLWYFSEGTFLFKTCYIDSKCSVCSSQGFGYRPELELIYTDFSAG